MTTTRMIPTPPRMRQAALACVLLGTFVGLFSGLETLSLGSLSEQRANTEQDAARFKDLADPAMIAAMREAQFAVVEGMKHARGFVLAALAVACAVAWVSATRLIRPDGLPREGVRKALVGSLLAAAVFRTIDGAQWTVVSQRIAAAGVHFVGRDGVADAEAVRLGKAVFSIALMGWSVGQTVLIAGAMLLLGQYFRSEKVKQVVALQDQQAE